MNNKYSQNRLERAKKSTTDAIKIASKRAIKKKAEPMGHLIGNKNEEKIANVSKILQKII